MNRRYTFALMAVLLALAGLVLGGVFLARMPRTYTLAVGPAGMETHRYAEALAKASVDAKDGVRYKVVTTSGAQESARLLEDNKVNLAIIRSDYELPANGQTLLVNTKRLVVVMAPQLRRGGIQKIADLKGKRVAVARLTDPNIPLVRRLLAVAELAENEVALLESELADIPELLATGRADAAIAVVVPGGSTMAEGIAQIARRQPNGLRFLPLTAAEAMASRVIGVETAELPAGIFGTGRPQEEVQTVAITYRTMARSSMPNGVAEQVARSLYELRTRVARQAPVAFTSEPPDAKTGARLPVHPGATAYFDGEAQTFFERYGDLMLTVLWGGTLVATGISAFLAWAFRRSHDNSGKLLDEILALTGQARAAPAAALPEIEKRVDAIVGELARQRARGLITQNVSDSASLALDHFRSVVETVRGRA
jgi:TRAP transporter TAXI family solute receptor